MICYSKAHLMILVTTSAFAYLLSLLMASLLWMPFSYSSSPILLVLSAVVTQQAARCAFVASYHVVEGAISASIKLHERQHRELQQQHPASSTNGQEEQNERNLMRLELNDWSCGIAGGIGFGAMHALMLYGTLLASESSTLGTLYQPSCPRIPSLVNSALNAMMFSLLDILLMLFAFYGMRRRRSIAPKQKKAGNVTIAASFIIHLMGGFSTTANSIQSGCYIALPLLGAVLIAASLFLYYGIGLAEFLPQNQRIQQSSSARRVLIANLN